MPTGPREPQNRLLDLFVTRYEDGAWIDSDKDRPDEHEDGAIDLIATRRSDGCRLAVEHTLIQPFCNERQDCEQFKPLRCVQEDPTLRVPERIVYVRVPVGTVQKGFEKENTEELREWVKQHRLALPEGDSVHTCVFSGRRGRTSRTLYVCVDPDVHCEEGILLIQRWGAPRLDQTVQIALSKKVPKLANTHANQRVLLLEYRSFSVEYKSVFREIERLRPRVPDLVQIDAIWFVETVPAEEISQFTLFDGRTRLHSFTFHDGRLLMESRYGLPVPVPHDG